MRLIGIMMLAALILNVKGCHLGQTRMHAAPPPKMVNVKLGWDMHTNQVVTGYRLYWGLAPGSYINSVDRPGRTNVFGTCSNLLANTTYYFACKAYTAQLYQSPPSNEIRYVTPNPPRRQKVSFQMQQSTNPKNGFQNLLGAVVSITNDVDPLIPGFYYQTLINTELLEP